MSAIPYVSTYWLSSRDYCIVAACDGVWDVLSDMDAAMLALSCPHPQSAAIKMRDEAYKFESGDNITVICCRLKAVK